MKKVVMLLCLCCVVVYGQAINFPDANFKARLLQASPSNGIAYSSSLSYIKIDVNGNGEIEPSEALMVNYLNIAGQNISNLEGLQYFTNMTALIMQSNLVSAINLSPFTQLFSLSCYNNQLTSLDLTGLTYLKNLYCYNNQLTQLDFSGLPNLKMVYCGNNQITSLDFSTNPLFDELGCKNSPNLTSIKIRNSRQQLFGSQTLLNECWSGCPNLNYICADAFEIPALQSYLQGCGITQAITIDSACPLLGVEEFERDSFTISPNPTKDNININYNDNGNGNSNGTIKMVQLYDSQGRVLLNKTSAENPTTLDVSGYASGVYFVKIVGEASEKIVKVVKE